jgi:hypothetical protein
MSFRWYHYAGGAVVGVVALPALLVGGGFLIPLLVAAAVGIAILAGPPAWELFNNKRIGEKGNLDVRQLITPDDEGGASVERKGGEQ